jgi:3-hydroxyisobutyrate dehydrogenase-like beta-hydroxyacid dehydrogenase
VDIGFIGLSHMGFPIARQATLPDEGADSDFTSAIKPMERAAGITVGPVGQQSHSS